ncbi:MAG: hypothetical protein ACFB3T_14850 [Geminicoccaceae bacterium]
MREFLVLSKRASRRASRSKLVLGAVAVAIAGCAYANDTGADDVFGTLDRDYATEAFNQSIEQALEADRVPALGLLLSVDRATIGQDETSALEVDIYCIQRDGCTQFADDKEAMADLERTKPGRIVGFDDTTFVALETNSICIYGYKNGRRVIRKEYPDGACD